MKPAYRRAVEEFYRSSVTTVDFGASGSGRVVAALNGWAVAATGGRVEELVTEEVGSEARLVVGSTAELLPRWLHPFDPQETSYSGQFWLPDGVTR